MTEIINVQEAALDFIHYYIKKNGLDRNDSFGHRDSQHRAPFVQLFRCALRPWFSYVTDMV